MTKDDLVGYIKEHKRGQIHLIFLNDAISRILRVGLNNDELDLFKDSLMYFDTDKRVHCLDEEKNLYPALSKIIPQNSICEMKYEHEKIDESLRNIKSITQTIEQLVQANLLVVKLKVEVRSFINLLSDHIAKENQYLELIKNKEALFR
ncbi:MAG: hemerythrin domain-containing protein [Bacteroidota bacterium]|nr:hemerythrin domain-containing protein [Bacteroidota bacterium]